MAIGSSWTNPERETSGLLTQKQAIVGGGADQAEQAALDVAGSRTSCCALLKLVNFIDKEDRLVTGCSCWRGGRRSDHAADVADIALHAAQPFESGSGRGGDHLGEAGFAHSRRTIQENGTDAVGLDGPPQEFARSKNVLLAAIFVEGCGRMRAARGASSATSRPWALRETDPPWHPLSSSGTPRGSGLAGIFSHSSL